MGMRTVNDPYGNNHSLLVDKLVGNAYANVKAVADRLNEIVYVAINAERILTDFGTAAAAAAILLTDASNAAGVVLNNAVDAANVLNTNTTTLALNIAASATAAGTFKDQAKGYSEAAALSALNAGAQGAAAGKRIRVADAAALSALTSIPGTNPPQPITDNLQVEVISEGKFYLRVNGAWVFDSITMGALDTKVNTFPVKTVYGKIFDEYTDLLSLENLRDQSYFRAGLHHLFVAGMRVTRDTDNTFEISGPNGPLLKSVPDQPVEVIGSRYTLGQSEKPNVLFQAVTARDQIIDIDIGDDFVLQVAGKRTAGGVGSVSGPDLGAFTYSDITTQQSKAAKYGVNVRRRSQSGLYQPTHGLVHHLSVGQSLTSWQAFPASTRPELMLDVKTIGQSINPQSESAASWAGVGDNLLHQAVPSVLSRGTPRYVLSDAEVLALPFSEANNGEGPIYAALAHFRKWWLRSRNKGVADPTNLFVISNAGVGGKNLTELSPGASPLLWKRVTDAMDLGVAAANTNSLSYAVGSFHMLQGEAEYSELTPQGTYKTTLVNYIAACRGAAASRCPGQVGTIPFYIYQTGGGYANDTLGLAVARAQLEVAAEVPGVFIVQNNQSVVDKAGHLTGNGSAATGFQGGKVMVNTVINAEGWECTRVLTPVIKNKTICLPVHTPVGPADFGVAYNGRSVAVAVNHESKGIVLKDNAGTIAVSNTRLVAPNVILADLARTVNQSDNPVVWIGSKTTFNGSIAICDSDSTHFDGEYKFVALTDGSNADENIADEVGLNHNPRNFALADLIPCVVEA